MARPGRIILIRRITKRMVVPCLATNTSADSLKYVVGSNEQKRPGHLKIKIRDTGRNIYMVWLIALGCIIAYIAGLFLLIKITPGLIKRAFDDALFIGVAAGAVFGAMLAFGGIGVIYGISNGEIVPRVFDALLLIILGIVALRTALSTLRPRYDTNLGTYRASRIMAGGFFVALAVASLVVLVLLFKPA